MKAHLSFVLMPKATMALAAGSRRRLRDILPQYYTQNHGQMLLFHEEPHSRAPAQLGLARQQISRAGSLVGHGDSTSSALQGALYVVLVVNSSGSMPARCYRFLELIWGVLLAAVAEASLQTAGVPEIQQSKLSLAWAFPFAILCGEALSFCFSQVCLCLLCLGVEHLGQQLSTGGPVVGEMPLASTRSYRERLRRLMPSKLDTYWQQASKCHASPTGGSRVPLAPVLGVLGFGARPRVIVKTETCSGSPLYRIIKRAHTAQSL